MKKYIVRAADGEFVEKEEFSNIDEATARADKLGEIFGTWNVEMFTVED